MKDDSGHNEIKKLKEEIELLQNQLKRFMDMSVDDEIEKSVILDTLSEMVAYYKSSDLKIHWANKTSANYVNKEPIDLVGKHCYEIWQNCDTPCPNCPVLKAFETKEIQTSINFDSYDRYWELKAVPVFSPDGDFRGVVEYGSDITQRVIAEKKLESQKEMLSSIMDHFPSTAIFLFNRDIEYVFAGGAALKETGYDPELIVGKKLTDILSKKTAEHLTPLYKECFEGKKHITEIDYKDQIYEVRIAPIFNKNNEIVFGLSIALDITKKKEIEKKLKESEKKFRTIFDHAPLGIFRSTPEGKFIEVNLELAKILGYNSPDEVLSSINNIAEDVYVRPGKRSVIVDQSINHSSAVRYENIYRRKNGEHFIANLYLQSIKDKQGNTLYLEGIVEDITERKKIEQALIDSEERFKTLYNNAPIPYQSLNTDGNFIEVNHTWLDMLGYEKDEVIGHNFSEFIAQPKEDFLSRFSKFLSVGEVNCGYFDMKCKNGKTIPVEFTGRVQYDDNSVPMHTHCVFHDITDRINVENTLRENEERFRKIFEDAPVGIYRTDIDGNIVFANRALAGILGYDNINDLLSINVLDKGYLEPNDREEFVNLLIKNKQINHFEKIWKRKDGTQIIINEHAHLVEDDKNGNLFFEGLVEDVTEKKRNEEALKKSEIELKQAIEVKDKFFDIIAHDLRSPISGILGLSDILAHQFEELTVTELREISHSFFDSSDNLYKLLDNLLQWTRLSKNRMVLKPEQYCILEMMDNIITLNQPQIKQKEILVHNIISPDLQAKVDINAFNTIFRNILTNSIKFTNKNGNVEISANESGAMIKIDITDDGVGMDKETLENIYNFETKITHKGTGGESGTRLGLLLCKELIQRSGGDINVRSELKKGTTVEVTLPKV